MLKTCTLDALSSPHDGPARDVIKDDLDRAWFRHNVADAGSSPYRVRHDSGPLRLTAEREARRAGPAFEASFVELEPDRIEVGEVVVWESAVPVQHEDPRAFLRKRVRAEQLPSVKRWNCLRKGPVLAIAVYRNAPSHVCKRV